MSESRTGPENTLYPERLEPGNGWRHRWERGLMSIPAHYSHRICRRRFDRAWPLVETLRADCLGLDETEFRLGMEGVRAHLRRHGLWDIRPSMEHSGFKGASAAESRYENFWSLLALYQAGREHAAMQPLAREQCLAACALLQGMVVEPLEPSAQASVIALVAAAAAMAGHSVHLLTEDDAASCALVAELQPSLQFFLPGLGAAVSPSLVTSPSSLQQRQQAYGRFICIVSAREALHDYLEDRLQLRYQPGDIGRKLSRLGGDNPLRTARMQGLDFAVLLNAQQALIEQACTPMILARQEGPSSVPPSAQLQAAAVVPRGRLTFQRFFRRYRNLCGVCEGAALHRSELWQVYAVATFPGPSPANASRADHRWTLAELPATIKSAAERREKSRLRRRMLQLDNQVGNLTSFSGQAE